MDLDLLKLFYNYDAKRSTNVEASEGLRAEIMKVIEDNQMAPLYSQSCSKFSWEVNSELLATMEAKNTTDLAAIETKLQEAITNAGEMEVLDGMFAKARHFAKIGSSTQAYEAYDLIVAKEKISTGKKIDATVEKAKVALFNCDNVRLKDIIGNAKKLVESGGDWDRRNRLKVYEAHFLMATKDLKGASKLLLDCVATFTANELCSYKTFMSYVILTNMLFLDRNDMKKKLVNDPHVITIIRELPNLRQLLNGLYICDYKTFFSTLLTVHDDALEDPYLGPMCTFILRELRVLAYAQFLQSYKSVQFSSMAATFNMSPKLLDAELSRFIAAGRINAKIDKVGDIIETKRPDKKNFQYQEVIKKGDALLNQIQKLVRVVDV